MKRKLLSIATVFFSSLFIYGCSGGGGNGDSGGQTTEVWVGSYTGPSPSSGSAPTGRICLSFKKNGAHVTGSVWVAGWIWKEDFSGTITANNTQLSGRATGRDLNGNTVTVDFNLSVSGNTITGTVTINGTNFNVSLQKDSTKSECGWAERRLANDFAQILGGAISGDPNSPDPLGRVLASFITEVPRVDVKVDGKTYQKWWACIWEVRDRTTTPTTEYTVAGIIDTLSVPSRMAGWYVKNATPSIGVADTPSLDPQDVNATLDGSNDPAVYTDGTLSFIADGTGDKYFNNGTSVKGDPFFVSPCDGGTQYKVWMSEISSFYIKFDGPSLSLPSTNHSFESPPNASSTNQNTKIPALYIEKVTCSP